MHCPAHTAWEDLSWDTSLQAWSPSQGQNRSGQGIKKKRPTQKSTGSPGPRGEERRTHHRLVFLVVWEPAVIFLPPYSTKPGQTATPTQPSTSSQTFFCRTITESAPFCLMQLDISISLQHFYVCILAVFQVFFPNYSSS